MTDRMLGTTIPLFSSTMQKEWLPDFSHLHGTMFFGALSIQLLMVVSRRERGLQSVPRAECPMRQSVGPTLHDGGIATDAACGQLGEMSNKNAGPNCVHRNESFAVVSRRAAHLSVCP